MGVYLAIVAAWVVLGWIGAALALRDALRPHAGWPMREVAVTVALAIFAGALLGPVVIAIVLDNIWDDLDDDDR